MKRRDFLWSATALTTAPKLLRPQTVPEPQPREAPYLALKKFVEPGSDEFACEKAAADITSMLREAARARRLPTSPEFVGSSLLPSNQVPRGPGLYEAVFSKSHSTHGWSEWLTSHGNIKRIEFYPLPGNLVRFEVTSEISGQFQYTTGAWRLTAQNGLITSLEPIEQQTASRAEPLFHDATEAVLQNATAYKDQLSKGIPYWRSRLDPATGIDLYGSNGIAVGDVDADGFDEIYVCQPGGIPNRLLKFAADGSLFDISEQWNAHMLDDTACALFLDLRNSGKQDLVVLRSGGPVLLINQGNTFRIRTDAFHFQTSPQGGFTGMAAADYDRDGKLDLYLCCYVYFQSEAQYTYAVPYHDAQNGPPNFLFHNRLNEDGSGNFSDVTDQTGLNENNNRFSFAPAWSDFNDDGWPDLYVANDFGRKNFYVNRQGHFKDEADARSVDDIGPGMSACWFDVNADGRADLYVGNMWTAAGQRVTRDPDFIPARSSKAKQAYLGHTMGNSLLEQTGSEKFVDTSQTKRVAFGRWAWASGGHDFDNDGVPEIFVTCGMLTNDAPSASSKPDLSSFFWRQVVNKSPAQAEAAPAYRDGWNALNQFIREDYSWNGHERNVFHVRRGERYFDFSGISGLDFADDSRSFAVLDFDDDGRPDLLVKSRLGPQIRVMQNNCAGTNHSVAFGLTGINCNRDAIGARIEVNGQVKWLSAGSEFLSQHSKRMLFGLGSAETAHRVHIRWPSGHEQTFSNLASGSTYYVTEGSPKITSRPFRQSQPLPASSPTKDNSLELTDTWFLEPIPLPDAQRGPGLLALDFSGTDKNKHGKYEIFRRYLFDWRAPLEPQLALLLNQDGHAVKIYASKPSSVTVAADLEMLRTPALDRATPYRGYYVGTPYRDFFKFGAAYLWAGYYTQSMPYLEKVLQRTPGNLRTLLLAGQVADELNHSDTAEAYYRRALAVDPKSAEASNGLGLVLGKRGRFDEARGYLQAAIEHKPHYAEAINNLGILFTQQGKMNDAIAAFQYGIKVAPDEDILYLNLGRAYIQTGKLESAKNVMQQLLSRKPDSQIARRALQEMTSRN